MLPLCLSYPGLCRPFLGCLTFCLRGHYNVNMPGVSIARFQKMNGRTTCKISDATDSHSTLPYVQVLPNHRTREKRYIQTTAEHTQPHKPTQDRPTHGIHTERKTYCPKGGASLPLNSPFRKFPIATLNPLMAPSIRKMAVSAVAASTIVGTLLTRIPAVVQSGMLIWS